VHEIRILEDLRTSHEKSRKLNKFVQLWELWGHNQGDRVQIQLASANLHWCSDEALLKQKEFAERYNVKLHMHLLETPYQKEYARRMSSIKTVMIGEENIFNAGSFTKIDKSSVLQALATSLQMPLTPEEQHRRDLSRRLFPFVKQFYQGWLDSTSFTPHYCQNSRD